MRLVSRIAVALAAFAAAGSAQAIVVNSLPYEGTPDWIDYKFDGNWSVGPNGESQLNTASGGIWFGNGNYNDGSVPSWSMGNATSGNKIDLTMRLTSGSRDWGFYMGDGLYGAGFVFNPTYGCNGNAQDCYFAAYNVGVGFSFADPDNPGQSIDHFIALDLTVNHTFGILLKDGLLAYRVDGEVFKGNALGGSSILVIGDGSGSTRTGLGSMLVSAVRIDTAPTQSVVLGVPEPASWAMLVGGFGLLGAVLRTTRRTVVSKA